MENKTIPALTEGLNEVIRPDLISDGQVTQSDNYYTNTVGITQLRTEPFEHKYPLPIGISGAQIIPFAVFSWIPNNYPTNHWIIEANYLLLVYDVYNDLYLLKLDENTESWVNVLEDNVPLFANIGLPKIAKTVVGIAFVDGRDNNLARYITINQWGEVRYGNIGIPAPLSMAEQLTDDEYNAYVDDESIDFGMDIPRGSILFFTYTMVTKDGVESNPSPLSVSTDLNYLKRDDDTFAVIDKYQRATFDGLRTVMADLLNSDPLLLETIEYFNIYMSYTVYTESNQAREEIRRTRRVPITNMLGDNRYISTTPFTGQLISYDNDVSCKGDDIAEASGVTFIANANSTVQFPFIFEHYFRITLNNQNNRNYVNGAFWIRLAYDDLVDRDGVQLISDFLSLQTLIAAHQIRIYDSDLTTPLPVRYKITAGDEDEYVDILVKIPYVPSSSEHNIYLCVGGIGVTVVNFQTAKYGRWLNIGIDWDNQIIIKPLQLKTSDDAFVISCEQHSGNDEPIGENEWALNKSDIGNRLILESGTLVTKAIRWSSREMEYILVMGEEKLLKYQSTNNLNAILIKGSNDLWDYSIAHTEKNIALNISKKGYVMFYFGAEDIIETSRIIQIVGDATHYLQLEHDWTPDPERHRFRFQMRNGGDVHTTEWLDVTDWGDTTPIDRASIFFSWNKNTNNIYLAVQRTLESINDVVYNLPPNTLPDSEGFDVRLIGNEMDAYIHQDRFFSQILVSFQDYIYEQIYVKQIMSFLPYFPEEWIGFHEVDNENKNITVHHAEKVGYFSRQGILRYSSIGGQTFPQINQVPLESAIMRVIPAPNYLHNGQYINSVLIFGVNGERKRFLLQGSPDGWVGQINDLLVREQSTYGLVAKEALLLVGETIFWLAPVGVMKENMNGLVNLSKDRIKLPNWNMDNPAMSFNPLMNMLFLHQGYGDIPLNIDELKHIEIKTDEENDYLKFFLYFNKYGVVWVDWGDGSEIEKFYATASVNTFDKGYAEASDRTIKIYATQEMFDAMTSFEIADNNTDVKSIALLESHNSLIQIKCVVNDGEDKKFIGYHGNSDEYLANYPLLAIFNMSNNAVDSNRIDNIFIYIASGVEARDGKPETGNIDVSGGSNGVVTESSTDARTYLNGLGWILAFNEQE